MIDPDKVWSHCLSHELWNLLNEWISDLGLSFRSRSCHSWPMTADRWFAGWYSQFPGGGGGSRGPKLARGNTTLLTVKLSCLWSRAITSCPQRASGMFQCGPCSVFNVKGWDKASRGFWMLRPGSLTSYNWSRPAKDQPVIPSEHNRLSSIRTMGTPIPNSRQKKKRPINF